MFDLESRNQDVIIISTKKTSVSLDVARGEIDAKLAAGVIEGPGEFEIGDVTIRGIQVESGRTIYDAEVGGVHIGVIGGIEEGLDDLGVADILCTSSVRAIREVEPKLIIAMGNLDGMVAELKLTARAEKKLKIKNRDALPVAQEIVALG